MGQARIISMETKSSGRLWKAAGVFALAAAGIGWYATSEPEHEPVKILHTAAQKPEARPSQVWSHVTQTDANGRQKPTNDMWGLLQRAQDEAEQAIHEGDIAYSKSLDDEGCQGFWVAHMNYQNMRTATDPVSKLDYYIYMPVRYAEFLASRDYGVAYSHELGVDNHGTAALTELVRGALPELQRRLHLNPQDDVSKEKYIYARFLASHYNLKVPHEPLSEEGYDALKEQSKLPRLRKAWEVLATTPQPADLTTLGSDDYVDYARLLARVNRDDDEYRLIREALHLTPQQADMLAMQATNIIDEQLRQHTVKMQQYMQSKHAPCIYK